MADRGASTKTGLEWMQMFMEAQGLVMANHLFLTFTIGQAGAAIGLAKTDEEKQQVRQMIEAMRQDARDLKQASAKLDRVVKDIIANAERNAAKL